MTTFNGNLTTIRNRFSRASASRSRGLLLAMVTVTCVGLACSSSGGGLPDAGSNGGTTTGGASSAGGTQGSGSGGQLTTTGGSTPTVGGSGNGGVVSSGGTSSAAGTTATAGKASTGGSSASGGLVTTTGGQTTTSSGGNTSAGGSGVNMGGASGTGGKTGAGGTSAAGGSAAGGAAGSTGTPGGGDTIPAGYPDPTAANFAVCKSAVPVAGGSGSYCPGGGVGPACVECLFGGSTYNSTMTPTATATSEAGNYAVTVTLGGTGTTAGSVYVSAESNRGLLPLTAIPAGKSLEYAFVVNVRPLEGQPEEANAAGGYPGLDLFFSGPTTPQVAGIGYTLVTAATKPIMVYMASDSTECDQTDSAFAGWGQMLPEYFHAPIGIANYGDSGESSSSFYGKADMWGAIKKNWVPGDWAMVQFGHNDKAPITDAEVQANLTKYVNDAQAAKVNIILVSPPARVDSIPVGPQTGTGANNDVGGLHAAAAKAAAAAANPPVPYIDLTALSSAWYDTLADKTAALQFHANHSDTTHTDLEGAAKLAGLVAQAIKDQNIGLAQYLR
jgi:lysophospholipase L1-like esterase